MSNRKFFILMGLLMLLTLLLGGCGGGSGGSTPETPEEPGYSNVPGDGGSGGNGNDNGSSDGGNNGGQIETVDAPYSDAYLEWLENGAQPSEYGLIPPPFDFSGLELPPVENNIPAVYPPQDEAVFEASSVRLAANPNYNDIIGSLSNMPAIRNQYPYGTCWAHAAIGAMEINAIKSLGASNSIDLSELQLAWYVYKDPGKSFAQTTQGKGTLDQGGHYGMSTAFFSRLAGPVDETQLPYNKAEDAYSVSGAKPNATDYTFYGLQLKDTSCIDFSNYTTPAQRDNIKDLIVANGAVQVSYYAGSGATSAPSGHAAQYYCDKTQGVGANSTNHAVLIVGWNDSIPASEFTNVTPPVTSNGAWLVRNSWGNTGISSSGYFWMSYEQYITNITAYTAGNAAAGLKHYGDDYIGFYQGNQSVTTGYGNTVAWMAKTFTAGGNETLKQVGFYTTDNNVDYEVYIYTGSGVTATTPRGGTLATAMPKTGSCKYVGYHTVDVGSIPLTSSQAFSVVIKLKNTTSTFPVAVSSTGALGYISPNGTSWTQKQVCIKAFTVPTPAVNTPPTITTASLPNGVVGVAYTTTTLAATGSTPITWTRKSGSLPNGLTLSSNGVISGTPTTAGNYPFTIEAKNDYGTDSKDYTVTVSGVAPTITTASLPNGVVGVAYTTTTLAATGSTPITWSVSGTLPPGLSLSNDVISGTPTAAGTYSFTVTATNNYGSDNKIYTVTIGLAPSITTPSLPDGTVGVAYSATLAATGSTPITWSMTPSIPGLTLNTSTGVLSGKPTVAGTYNVTVTASNIYGSDSTTYTVTVSLGAKIATNSLPNGSEGSPYTATITTTGTLPITLNVTSALPSGLTFTDNSNGTGTLSGTPGAGTAGTHSVTVTASNSYGGDSKTYTLKINSGTPVIKAAALPDGAEGMAYPGATLTATGPGPITWADDGTLATIGLTLNTSTGAISGTPAAGTAGTHNFTATATNAYGSTTRQFTITIKSAVPGITTASLSKGTVNMYYEATLLATIGVTWSLDSGNLPGGLTLVSGTGKIYGTPTASGTFTFTVKATSTAAGGGSTTKQFSITINAAAVSGTQPTITGNVLSTLTAGTAFSATLSATGSTPITWSVANGSSLPGGLTLDTGTGLLHGTPTAAGTFTFSIVATNAFGSHTVPFQITVESASSTPIAPVITTASLPGGVMRKKYSFQLKATGEPTFWSKVSGALPTGLQLESDGDISGTPNKEGTYSFTVRAENSAGHNDKSFTIVVTRR